MTQAPARSTDAPTTHAGETTPSRQQAAEPRLPHEHDESRHSQRQTTPEQKAVGSKAYQNATDGTADTDKGPVMDKVYDQQTGGQRDDVPRE